LYYAWAVDPTLIMPINVLASEQTKSTSDTADKAIKLLNYCTIHPETKIRYHASNMILYIYTVMHLIFQKKKPKAEHGDSLTWTSALTQPTNLPTG
jgi:hypothetical protein